MASQLVCLADPTHTCNGPSGAPQTTTSCRSFALCPKCHSPSPDLTANMGSHCASAMTIKIWGAIPSRLNTADGAIGKYPTNSWVSTSFSAQSAHGTCASAVACTAQDCGAIKSGPVALYVSAGRNGSGQLACAIPAHPMKIRTLYFILHDIPRCPRRSRYRP